MTRITEHSISVTPCCGTSFTLPPFFPVNFQRSARWTDGHVENGLAPDDGDLKKCQCGSWFLLSQADPIEVIQKPLEYREATWDLRFEAWLRKRRNETTQEAMERLFRVKPKNVLSVPQVQIPSFAKRLEDDELKSIIESDLSDINLMIVARRRYWRYLNHPYRENSQKINLADIYAYPTYEPSAAQQENMRSLVFMLEAIGSKNRVEIAELYRQLGDFEKALRILDSAKDQSLQDALVIHRLIVEKLSGPVRYPQRTY